MFALCFFLSQFVQDDSGATYANRGGGASYAAEVPAAQVSPTIVPIMG
jgi:hypothetical protein